jgi:hypothetical protein
MGDHDGCVSSSIIIPVMVPHATLSHPKGNVDYLDMQPTNPLHVRQFLVDAG